MTASTGGALGRMTVPCLSLVVVQKSKCMNGWIARPLAFAKTCLDYGVLFEDLVVNVAPS